MRAFFWGVALSASLSLTLPSASPADENPWVPAFTARGGVHVASLDASAASSSALRRPVEGDQRATAALLGLGIEISTPKLPLFLSPALFLHTGVGFSVAPGWNVAKEGNAGQVDTPPLPNGNPTTPSGATGTGTTAFAEMQGVVAEAGVGVALEVPLEDRTLRIKPSFEYRRDEIGYRLRLADVQLLDGLGDCSPCGIAQLSTRDNDAYHSIGPGLEVEYDAIRAEDFMVTLFASTRAYRVLGDRKKSLNLTGAYTPSVPSQEPLTALARFERDPWEFQLGVGLRLRWLPQ